MAGHTLDFNGTHHFKSRSLRAEVKPKSFLPFNNNGPGLSALVWFLFFFTTYSTWEQFLWVLHRVRTAVFWVVYSGLLYVLEKLDTEKGTGRPRSGQINHCPLPRGEEVEEQWQRPDYLNATVTVIEVSCSGEGEQIYFRKLRFSRNCTVQCTSSHHHVYAAVLFMDRRDC